MASSPSSNGPTVSDEARPAVLRRVANTSLATAPE